MNKNFVVFALVMFTLGSLATYSAPQALADWLIDQQGNLTRITAVLGDQTPETTSTSNTSEPITTPEPKSTAEPTEAQKQQQESLKQQQELRLETAKKLMEQKREITKFMLEARKEGKLGVKQNIQDKSGKTIKQTETEIPTSEHLDIAQPDGEPVEIEALKPGELEITKNKFAGRTRLPISVNANNELVVTRPDGTTKVVSVLPDEAIDSFTKRGLSASEGTVELTTSNTGDPVYQVKEEVSKKFLGLIPVTFGVQSTVSATDPNAVTVTSTETSIWKRFLERLSR